VRDCRLTWVSPFIIHGELSIGEFNRALRRGSKLPIYERMEWKSAKLADDFELSLLNFD